MNDLISKLSDLRSQYNCFDESERDAYDTLSEAIKVLSTELELATDTISRQAAIDALAKFVPYAICDESTESYVNGLTDAYNLICQLPSAQPRKGMWIPINPGARIKHFFKCSLCGSSIDTFCISSDINYCPNCGHPMMRGEEE